MKRATVDAGPPPRHRSVGGIGTAEREQEAVSPASGPGGNCLVLDGITWQTYSRLLRVFDDRYLRITYDRGRLEIVTLSPEHERFKHLLGYLIGVLVEELGWNMAGFGSMTFKRSRERLGLEPHECYWIQSEPQVRGKDAIDPRHDPPPDLVVEIDVTHSSLDRLSIYAALSVPEIWRFNGQTLFVHQLDAEGAYAEIGQSRAFPFLPVAEVARFLGMRSAHSETELVRQFRAWVRERIAAGWVS